MVEQIVHGSRSLRRDYFGSLNSHMIREGFNVVPDELFPKLADLILFSRPGDLLALREPPPGSGWCSWDSTYPAILFRTSGTRVFQQLCSSP